MTKEEKYILRNDAWDKAIHSFGKSYIFSNRSVFYKNWIRFLTILGILVPLLIGATASGYGLDSPILKWTITISIPITIFQLVISIFSTVNRWSDNLAYSLEAANDYSSLSDSFKKLGKTPPNDCEVLKHQLEILETRYNSRSEQDSKYNLRERELRKGMRYALREFQRECVGCNTVPLSMESTNCDVCGKFKRNKIQKLIYNG